MKMKNLLIGSALALGFVVAPLVADDDAIRDVDDNAASFSGSWGTSTNRLLYYGDDYQYAWGSGTGTPTAEAVWTTPQTNDISGSYEVFVRWSVQENREESAVYRVYDGVADTGANCSCSKNQTLNGGAWQYCCTANLTAGQKGVVKLGNENTNTNEVVIADGVRFVRTMVDSGNIVNSSIYDYDIADEAGVEYSGRSQRDGNITALCNGHWSHLATISVSAPTTGYIIANTSGYYNPAQANHYMRVCISDVSTGANCVSHAPIMERETSHNYTGEMRWALNEVFSVGAGTKTIYLKGCKEYSTTTGQIGWNDFYGIFVPTKY